MMRIIRIIGCLLTLSAVVLSCSKESSNNNDKLTPINLRTSVEPMIGDTDTKVNVDGDDFLNNDLIRLKIVTPYDNSSQFGENTWGGSVDNFFLLKRAGEDWSTNLSSFKFDIDGDGKYGDNAPSLHYLAQQTPYVFTANTWDRCLGCKIGGSWKVFYKSTFYADQSVESNFRASDLLWAQTVMQTGTSEVTLCFHHVLSKLSITIPSGLTNPVVTLEGVPDVDQEEFAVGNKYSNKDISYSNKMSYAHLSYVSDESFNGKVLGITGIVANEYKVVPFESIENCGVYTAYKYNDSKFLLIVPPVKLGDKAQLVVRSGNDKYVYSLKDMVLQANVCHPIDLSIN